MKKYIIYKKLAILFFAVFLSFGIARVSIAKLTDSNTYKNNVDITTDTTKTNTEDSKIVPQKDNTAIQNEIGSVEKSVKKTEDVLNNLDQKINKGTKSNNIIKNVENKDNSRVRNENNSNFHNNESNVGEDISAQVEVLKALKKRSFFSNKKIKSRILDDGIKSVSDKKIISDKKDKNEVETKDSNTNADNAKKETTTNVKNGIEDTTSTGDNVNKETKSVENDTLKKKAKIIAREKTSKARVESSKDSDGDGISNYDEINIYGTNPYSADTNGNGYVDGAEILAGFNPNSKSGNSPIVYASPKNTGTVDKNLFAVSKIDIKKEKIKNYKQVNATSTVATSTNTNITTFATTTAEVLSFKGKSLPNSFVTLYIYSIPTVVTVKTDEDGNWNYTMDKELENGNHEIYVAMTDSSGNIIAKSDPIPFVKKALAVTVNQKLLSNQINDTKPSFFSSGYVYMTILILIFLIGIILTVIGIKLGFRKEKVEDIV